MRGLKWDGEPLTVDDVVFTYNDMNEKIPTDIKDILRIGKSRALPKIRKLDNRRVEFTVLNLRLFCVTQDPAKTRFVQICSLWTVMVTLNFFLSGNGH